MKKFILPLLVLLTLFCVAATPPVKNPVWVGGTDSRIYEGSGLKYYPNGSTNAADVVYSLADLINASTNTTISIRKLDNTGASAGDVIGFDGTSNVWVSASGIGAFTNVVNLGTGTNVLWVSGKSLLARSVLGSEGITITCPDGSNIVVAVTWDALKATNDTYYAALSDFTTLSGTVSGHTTAIGTLQGGTNQWNLAVTNVVTDVPFLQFLIANNVATLSTNSTRIPYSMIAQGTATNKQALVYNEALGLWEPQDQIGGGSDPAAITNIVSTGTGSNLVQGVASRVGTMKSIIGAGTTTITDDGSTITVTSSGGVGTVTNAANVGVGVGMFSDLTDGVLSFKSVRSDSSAITIGDTPTNAVVNVDWAVFAATNNILYAQLGADNTFLGVCNFNTNVSVKVLRVDSIKRSSTPFAVQNSDAGGSLFTVVEGSSGNGGFNVYDSAWTARINAGATTDGGYMNLYDGSGATTVRLVGGTDTNKFNNKTYFNDVVSVGTNGCAATTQFLVGEGGISLGAGWDTVGFNTYYDGASKFAHYGAAFGLVHSGSDDSLMFRYSAIGAVRGAPVTWKTAGRLDCDNVGGGWYFYTPINTSNLTVKGTAVFNKGLSTTNGVTVSGGTTLLATTGIQFPSVLPTSWGPKYVTIGTTTLSGAGASGLGFGVDWNGDSWLYADEPSTAMRKMHYNALEHRFIANNGPTNLSISATAVTANSPIVAQTNLFVSAATGAPLDIQMLNTNNLYIGQTNLMPTALVGNGDNTIIGTRYLGSTFNSSTINSIVIGAFNCQNGQSIRSVSIGNSCSVTTSSITDDVRAGYAVGCMSAGGQNVLLGASAAGQYGSGVNRTLNRTVAVGYKAAENHATGSADGTFIGNTAGRYAGASIGATVVGSYAGTNNWGNYDLSGGAGTTNVSLFGYNAQASPGVTNSTAIGANSVVTENDTMVLGNASVNVKTPGRFNGYTWPGSDGGSNYVMVTDGAGHLSFAQVGGVAGIVLTGQGYLDAENSTLNLRSLANTGAAINFYPLGGANTNTVTAYFNNTGNLVLNSNIVYATSFVTNTPTMNLDFNGPHLPSIFLTNDVALTPVNVAAGSSLKLRVVADGSARNVIITNGWTLMTGCALTNAVAGNKTGELEVTYYGATAASAVAKWNVQP